MIISFPVLYLEISIIFLRKMDILVCLKNVKKNNKTNHRRVRILPNLSQIYEN